MYSSCKWPRCSLVYAHRSILKRISAGDVAALVLEAARPDNGSLNESEDAAMLDR